MSEHAATRDHLLSNKMYDHLKRLAQIGLPAAGTLYFALAQIWGLPNGEEVVGTVVAVDAFLGLLLGYANRSYNNSEAKYDGVIDVKETEAGDKLFDMTLLHVEDPQDLEQLNEVVFKVRPS